MKAITKILAAGVAVAALASAAPAAAQYYPGYPGYGYGGGNVVGQIINSVVGGGYNGYAPYGYNNNSQAIVNQCAGAVQARLSGGYGGYGAYGGGYGYSPYGNGYAGGARVLGISRVEQGLAGAINVHGVATSGGYASGYNGGVPDLVWKCRADPRGAIIGLDVHPAQRTYGGYGYAPQSYTPYNPYSQYGYVRY